MTKPMTKLPQESWEKEITKHNQDIMSFPTPRELFNANKRLKSFIQQLLTSDRQRVVEILETKLGNNNDMLGYPFKECGTYKRLIEAINNYKLSEEI